MTTPPIRMPLPSRDAMNEAQRAAADELIAGPRKGIYGPFIALLRSPDLMARLQKVGEYLRFGSTVPPRLSEFAILLVSRAWTQQFEWAMHVPLALKAGVAQETIDAIQEGRRPSTASAEELAVFDFTSELLAHHGVSDVTYQACVSRFGEQGVVDLVSINGYVTTMSMVLNVAHIPAESNGAIIALPPLPR